MQTVKDYTMDRETFEKQNAAGRYHPALEITYRDHSGVHTHTLDAGSNDHIEVFRDACATYVLSYNYSLDYVGVQAFKCGEQVWNHFVDQCGLDEMRTAGDFRKSWSDYSTMNLLKILLQWWQD